jgi:hypothetical protein
MLSKSKYLRGVKCMKNLWLYSFKREFQSVSDDNIRIFNSGTNVGQLAQAYFPEGEFAVQPNEIPTYETARLTQELIQSGAETIYEAAFIYNDTIVAVDLLRKEANGWHIYEVKSTNNIKPEHIVDVAVQYYVLKSCGLEIIDASVMHFDRTYIRRGKLNATKLFRHESVLNAVLNKQHEIATNITSIFPEMLQGAEPNIKMGNQCNNPYECDFKCYCKSLLPETPEEVKQLLSNEPQVNKVEVNSFLNTLKYPLCHLDFETIMPAVPMFDESRPYQQITFQYSLHHQQKPDGEVKHTEYLAMSNPDIDPRLELITQLIAETLEAQTILVYNMTFERCRIQEMMRDFPHYAAPLQSIIDRMIDLMVPFRKKHFTTESLGRYYSIKLVLPALCPDVSYNELEINNGMDASNQFLDLYNCTDEKHITNTRQHLLKYCHLDTLAMVRILEVLKRVKQI